MFIRTAVNRTGHTVIQVAQKINRQNRVIKHIGTARSPLELAQLKEQAQAYVNQRRIESGVISLFDSRFAKSELETLLNHLRFAHVFDTTTYQFLQFFYDKVGFGKIGNECFKDLVIARIVDPASKRKTRDILETRFGKIYSLTFIYRTLRSSIENHYQPTIEQIIYRFATDKLREALVVLFFDVTTLYFETSGEDGIRKCGFSKDQKHNQPQIVVALIVTSSGIPLMVRMFGGNTFEGHTMLPCIESVKRQLRLTNMIVVADSAMLSEDNLLLLEAEGLEYIVGARLGNMNVATLEQIDKSLPRMDGAHIRINLDRQRALIASYSKKRALKDRSDREKQIRKAKEMLNRPDRITRRYKFLRSRNRRYEINQTLIKKAEMLEGIKGYVTNATGLSDEDIISKYASLWQVEKSFRMSKSDLRARPVFHTLKESIEAHLLIVFAALVVARYIEIVTHISIHKAITILNQVKEIIVEDPVSGQTVSKYSNLTEEAKRLLKLTNVWVT